MESMSGMDMSNMSGMDMTTSASASSTMMNMGTTATASATSSGSSASSTGMDMSSMDMSGMDMSSDSGDTMMMNSYLVTTYSNYPVVFKTLKAHSGGAAFGVFCAIFFSAFFLRGLFFLSAYLEQKVFHNYTNAVLVQEVDNCACDPESEDEKSPFGALKRKGQASMLRQLFFPGLAESGKDIIRLLIAFVSAMFGYALMLAAMSFVILYFFAACLGIAFGEVFFNRLSIVLGINKNSALCGALH
ncbi:unnamed protein product [Ambrosiozyma monospora]|uniref:Unnamed protein product n=2 Tax=Ambrosiozyma monospora TaxID=43982 RepID=A0ACB5TAX8_AMBMO|nr:unnamed protein product [Ambrosiozyma monospora]